MLPLLPGPRFLFLQFPLGELFPLCNLLFWFTNDLLFCTEDHVSVAGTARVGINPLTSAVRSAGSFVQLAVLRDQGVYT